MFMKQIKFFIFLTVLFLGVFSLPKPASALWVYEQNFNSLTTGDLNGQDSWSGPVIYDVENTVVYEGANAVGAGVDGSNNVISRTITGVTDGSVYFAMRRSAELDGIFFVSLNEGASQEMRIYFTSDGVLSILNGTDNSNVNLLAGASSVNTWYPINVEFDDVAQPDKYRARAYSSGSWQAFSSWYPILTNGTYASIDGIGMRSNSTTCGCTLYVDNITATNPNPPVTVKETEEYYQIFE